MTSTWTRYLVLQLPGFVLAAGVAFVVWESGLISGRVALGAWAAWVLKDLLLYPLVKGAYETRAPTGAERLVGCIGIAETVLNPAGQLRVQGELWRARLQTTGRLDAGKAAEVTAVDGLTLIVRACSAGGSTEVIAPTDADRK